MFFIPQRIAFPFALILLAAWPTLAETSRTPTPATDAPSVASIRFWSFQDVTRVAIETSGDYSLYSEQIEKPNRVYFDMTGLRPPAAAQHAMQVIKVGDPRIRQIRVARLAANKTRIVLDLDSVVDVASSQLVNPDRLMIEVHPRGGGLPSLMSARPGVGSRKVEVNLKPGALDRDIVDNAIADVPVTVAPKTGKVASDKTTSQFRDDPNDAYHPARNTSSAPVTTASATVLPVTVPPVIVPARLPTMPTTNAAADNAVVKPGSVGGDRSLVRVFGLKLGRVVIDAGHGGHDSGTVGPNGLMEKDLVLDVALRLGALITRQMGAEVIYTRSSDVFIPLEERTKIANDQKADLFISVHANSSPEPSASGVETYYFNLTSDRGGLDLATRENATAGSAISDLGDLLHRAVLQTKREESRDFAQKVQASLYASSLQMNRRERDRGVRQAPFMVLIGATMPSILAEIGFVSNPHDERLMRRTDQRQKIAEALYKGVSQYASSLSHVQLARAGSE